MLVLGQEHRLLADSCAEVGGNMSGNGWCVAFSAALWTGVIGKESALCTSAGTHIAIPNHSGPEALFPYDLRLVTGKLYRAPHGGMG